MPGPDLPRDAIGLGLRARHVRELLADRRGAVDCPVEVGFLELLAENYMVEGGRPLEVAERIAARYPTILHGVGLYLGNAEGVDRAHLQRLTALAKRTNARWVSDHLCWGSVGGVTTHDLLPLPYTREAVALCVDGIRAVQDALGVPFIVENVSSYAAWRESEMEEWAFVSEVVEGADCGLLLDVNNIYVSALNHGFDALDYLDGIPAERVAQIHLAGHSRHTDCVIDTHDGPVDDAVWSLYAEALRRTGSVPTMLEWDAHIPPLAEVLREARRARPYLDAARHSREQERRHAA